MPGCVLRASGRAFDVDAFISSSRLEPCAVYYRGRKRLKSEPLPRESGINVHVSRGDDLTAQIADAIDFLSKNRAELRRLIQAPGFEGAVLDFGVAQTDAYVDYHKFPAALIALAADFGLDIWLTEYPMDDLAG